MEELRAVAKEEDGTYNPVNKESALRPAAPPTHPPRPPTRPAHPPAPLLLPLLIQFPSHPNTLSPPEAASIMAMVQGLQKDLQTKEQEVLQVSGFISAACQQIDAMESHQMNLRGSMLLFSDGLSKDMLDMDKIDAQVAVHEVNELNDSVLLGAGAAVGGGYAPAPLPVHASAPADAPRHQKCCVVT